MIPPAMAVVDLLSGLASMKWVHFMPTVETNTARVERNMLSTITALVAWTSAGGGGGRGGEEIQVYVQTLTNQMQPSDLLIL